MIARKIFIIKIVFILTAGLFYLPISAHAQANPASDYPNKPIKLVIPFPAGGSSDGIGRQIADKLSGVLKQTVIVDNKGGAGGIIGTDYVAKAAPDGYTLV